MAGNKLHLNVLKSLKRVKKNASPQITGHKLFSEPCLTVLTERRESIDFQTGISGFPMYMVGTQLSVHHSLLASCKTTDKNLRPLQKKI